jgi:hypothetical protein
VNFEIPDSKKAAPVIAGPGELSKAIPNISGPGSGVANANIKGPPMLVIVPPEPVPQKTAKPVAVCKHKAWRPEGEINVCTQCGEALPNSPASPVVSSETLPTSDLGVLPVEAGTPSATCLESSGSAKSAGVVPVESPAAASSTTSPGELPHGITKVRGMYRVPTGPDTFIDFTHARWAIDYAEKTLDPAGDAAELPVSQVANSDIIPTHEAILKRFDASTDLIIALTEHVKELTRQLKGE